MNNQIIFESRCGKVEINLSGVMNEIERKGVKEKYIPISSFYVGEKDICKLSKTQFRDRNLTLRFIISKNTWGNSYDFDEKLKKEFIYVKNPNYNLKPEKAKYFFVYSLFHEIGHAELHQYQSGKSLIREREAWIYSITAVTKNFGILKKGEIPCLTDYIFNSLETYI